MTETKLPDFDDMFNLADVIRDLTLEKLTLETEISEGESEVIEYNVNNKEVNGKPPSMEYAKIVWKPLGREGKLVPKRKRLAIVEADLAKAKSIFDIYKSMIAVWQTESANKRASTL